MKKISKERLDRLFNNGYGIIRIKKFALTKAYSSYTYMIKEVLWALVGIPINLILDICKTVLYLLNFIPRIYIEEKTVRAKTYSLSGHFDIDGNYVVSQYCPICNTYLGDYDDEETVECSVCRTKVEINVEN